MWVVFQYCKLTSSQWGIWLKNVKMATPILNLMTFSHAWKVDQYWVQRPMSSAEPCNHVQNNSEHSISIQFHVHEVTHHNNLPCLEKLQIIMPIFHSEKKKRVEHALLPFCEAQRDLCYIAQWDVNKFVSWYFKDAHNKIILDFCLDYLLIKVWFGSIFEFES